MSQSLFEVPGRYWFFQAVRVLLRDNAVSPTAGERLAASPDGPRMLPLDQIVRFRGGLGMAFPAAGLPTARAGDERQPPELSVAFFGVASPASFGSLPTVYTQLAAAHPAVRDFLDIFNQRLIELFYRALERSEITASAAGDAAAYEHVLGAILGLGFPALRNRLPFERPLLRAAGIVARTPATAAGIVDLVGEVLGLSAEVVEGVPQWEPIEADQRCVLGGEGRQLGASCAIGRRIRSSIGRLRVRIGPLNWSDFESCQPGGERFDELVLLIRSAVGPEFEFQIQLVLERDDVPPLVLGRSPGRETRIGRSAWLKRGELRRDPDEAVFPGQARRARPMSKGPAPSR